MKISSVFCAACAFALVCCVFPSLHAAGRSGATAVPMLKMDFGARPLGMGGAFAAVSDDIYGVRYNPAGLGRFKSMQAGAMYVSGIADTNMQFFGFGMPLALHDFYGVSGLGLPAIAASLVFSGNGDMDYNATNANGTPVSPYPRTLSAGGDTLFTAAYGERIAVNSSQIYGRNVELEHYIGAAFKYISSKLPKPDGGQYSASALAFDLGYINVEPDRGFSMGLVVSNIGGSVKFISEKDPLPVIIRLGFAHQSYYENFLGGGRGILSMEADRYMQDREYRLKAGVEYMLRKLFAFRLGYQGLQDAGGLTAGFGVRKDRMYFDFSMAFSQLLGNAFAVARGGHKN